MYKQALPKQKGSLTSLTCINVQLKWILSFELWPLPDLHLTWTWTWAQQYIHMYIIYIYALLLCKTGSAISLLPSNENNPVDYFIILCNFRFSIWYSALLLCKTGSDISLLDWELEFHPAFFSSFKTSTCKILSSNSNKLSKNTMQNRLFSKNFTCRNGIRCNGIHFNWNQQANIG